MSNVVVTGGLGFIGSHEDYRHVREQVPDAYASL